MRAARSRWRLPTCASKSAMAWAPLSLEPGRSGRDGSRAGPSRRLPTRSTKLRSMIGERSMPGLGGCPDGVSLAAKLANPFGRCRNPGSPAVGGLRRQVAHCVTCSVMGEARPQFDPAASAGGGVAEDCLAGGGDLGALMRSMDWSKTPLGPVASWPQSLRTTVSIMLSSGFAIVVAWGPEFIFLYNDRYRPVLGRTKHRMALGNRSADIFPEVWDFIGALFRPALAGK